MYTNRTTWCGIISHHPTLASEKPISQSRWLKEMRPDLEINVLSFDLLDSTKQADIENSAGSADVGVCAVDNEPAKFQFDALMRKFGKPWTLGEVLSGGIGGWIHRFISGGPCYGCVASHLQRSIVTDNSPPPDYSNPGGPVRETTIPASKASINAIAGLHALMTLDLLEGIDPGFTSSLLTLAKVDGVFPEAFRPYKFRIARSPECLICGQVHKDAPAGEELDVALDQALARLGHE